MAKRGTIDLTSERPTVGGLRRTEKRGPIVPVSAYGKARYYLQDGRYIPAWFVWLRRRKFGLALALLLLVAGAVAVARLLLGGKSDGS